MIEVLFFLFLFTENYPDKSSDSIVNVNLNL